MAVNQSKYACRSPFILKLTALMLILLFSGCSAKPMLGNGMDPPVSIHHAAAGTRSKSAADRTVEQQLRAVVGHWIGTPHKMGGKDHRGIDCSGFVQRVVLDVFHIRLPRSTAQQVQTGRRVNATKLSAGDLVFFHPPNKIRHVGIFLGRGEFAHASASRGVTISSLDTSYWRQAYWTSRRIVPSGE